MPFGSSRDNYRDLARKLAERERTIDDLKREVSRLESELASARSGEVASFAVELEKRTGFVREFSDSSAALEFFSQAMEARKMNGALNPGESVDSWRQRQLLWWLVIRWLTNGRGLPSL